jgi:hypothetical protein
MLAARAAMSADELKLSSYVEQMTRPKTTGINANNTRPLHFSPKTILAKRTVKTGAADLTVSANETGANQRAINPKRSVENLRQPTMIKILENLSFRNSLFGEVSCAWGVVEIIPIGTFTWKYPPMLHISSWNEPEI